MLIKRAEMFTKVRQFFAARSVLEVDTPILSQTAPIATYIDVIETRFKNGERGYLHTSPEYAMKRLLSQGIGDIYQLSHVFRDGEVGSYHNPEFTLVEWYRVGFSLEQLIEETLELIYLFIPKTKPYFYSYEQLFEKFAGCNYKSAQKKDFIDIINAYQLVLPYEIESWDHDAFLYFIMSFIIEPQLQDLTIIHSYPSSQAALACLKATNEGMIAERFEVYFKGVELANGFHELSDSKEQRHRFIEENLERKKKGKPVLPIDENFLSALASGFPDSCGVAVGFDRLMMLHLHQKEIHEILPFSWKDVFPTPAPV